ncbi:MAG: Stk1 family PASTA domain-containing Ser/Thr kinase [Oscillospiraceae bacterium]|nr:Stk1 family PASTA domain-containing Ser/Thr kinase [Oscillospiraceae bacterium]MDD4413900.1 Stk1 family PASTA domain-containing Ser/Thr kinase [Oscillospiraceae bacterium]
MDKYIGKRLDGRYEIREVIGVGGMAYVYKAYDTIDDRTVAVKILKDEFLANEEFTRRFKNESKAIAILSHPNIVKVFDVSFGDRIQYIVMEFIDGITLKEYIDQQQDIRWKEAVHFTVQILRALQHAHDKGIVHRDIKPQNIMLLADGTIKVTDFGIARFARSDIRLTSATEKAIGSVHYISPEQARGEITDEKADIYSVGVMLYEMLSGKLPFEADNAVSVAIMQMQTEPENLHEINPDIPDGLEEITVKAMQKDPAKRYQSAAEMLYDIDEFKRNPSIHFAYKYFVDETPTRFVEAITRVKGADGAEDNVSEAGDEYDEDEGEHKSTPVIPILAAIAGAFVLVGLLFAGIVFMLKIFGEKPTEEVEVQNFIGMNYADVVNNKEYLDKFSFDSNFVNSETVPEGEIIEQEPRAPTKIKLKKAVKLTISKGPQMITIPDVRKNEHKDVVEQRLVNSNFKVQFIQKSSEEVEVDFVIKILPSSGEQLAKGSTVQVFVSTGKTPVPDEKVPNIVLTNIETAKETILQNNFIVGKTVYINHNSYPRDTVISQNPAKDTMLAPGSAIDITVASGFKDFDLVVPMPNTTTPLDMIVYIDGKHAAKFDNNNFVPINTAILKLTETKGQYDVLIKLRKHTATGSEGFNDYVRYTVYSNEQYSEITFGPQYNEVSGATSSTTSNTTSTSITTTTSTTVYN